MIRGIKYVYWYILSLVAYIMSRKELSGKVRWQYYCWMNASRKSKPKASRMIKVGDTTEKEDA